jgi:hypothetical protein
VYGFQKWWSKCHFVPTLGKYRFGKDKISNEDKVLLVLVKEYGNSFTLEKAKDFLLEKLKR